MKKRTKKLLVLRRALLRQRATASKSFLLLFFKKEALAFLLAAPFVKLLPLAHIAGARQPSQSSGSTEEADATGKACKPPKKPAADRSRLTKAEAELHNLEERRKSEETVFRQQLTEFERRQEAARARTLGTRNERTR